MRWVVRALEPHQCGEVTFPQLQTSYTSGPAGNSSMRTLAPCKCELASVQEKGRALQLSFPGRYDRGWAVLAPYEVWSRFP